MVSDTGAETTLCLPKRGNVISFLEKLKNGVINTFLTTFVFPPYAGLWLILFPSATLRRVFTTQMITQMIDITILLKISRE